MCEGQGPHLPVSKDDGKMPPCLCLELSISGEKVETAAKGGWEGERTHIGLHSDGCRQTGVWAHGWYFVQDFQKFLEDTLE